MVAWLCAWLVLIGIAATGPDGDGVDGERVLRWLRFQGEPSLIAVFNLLGVWPMAFLALLMDDRDQPLPAWPFVFASFAAGGFALLPYLAMRRPGADLRAPKTRLQRFANARGLALALLAATWGLVGFGLAAGSPAAYREVWATSSLAYTMTADIVVLTVAWWPVLLDDVRRRGGPAWAAGIGAVPLVGMPVWLVARRRAL